MFPYLTSITQKAHMTYKRVLEGAGLPERSVVLQGQGIGSTRRKPSTFTMPMLKPLIGLNIFIPNNTFMITILN